MHGLLATAALAAETAIVAGPLVAVDLKRDRAQEDIVEAWTRLDARASGGTDSSRWRLGVRAEHALRAGIIDDGGDLEAQWWIAPQQCGWDGGTTKHRVRLGYLVERWGKLDLLPVADQLNGRDLRSGVFVPSEWVRVPAPLLTTQHARGPVTAALTVLPFGAHDLTTLWGTDHALIRQGQLEQWFRRAAERSGDPLTEQALQSALLGAASALEGIDAQLRQGLSTGIGQGGRPQPLAESVDVGARARVESDRMDIGLSVAWIRNRSVAPTASPELIEVLRSSSLPSTAALQNFGQTLSQPVQTEWPRTAFAGLDASRTAGPVALRAEAGFWSARTVPQPWLRATTSPATAVGGGVDWTPSTATLVSLETRWSQLLDSPERTFLIPARDVELAWIASQSLLRERVRLSLAGRYSHNYREVVYLPSATYRPSDQLEIDLAAGILSGGPPTPQTLEEALQHAGGPASYWGDTDALSVSVKWIQ